MNPFATGCADFFTLFNAGKVPISGIAAVLSRGSGLVRYKTANHFCNGPYPCLFISSSVPIYGKSQACSFQPGTYFWVNHGIVDYATN